MSRLEDESVWTPSGIPYQVQEDGFIYGEFHRLTFAIVFAKALYETESWTGRVPSIMGPDGWVNWEYENE